jgi:hypothetical protein
MTTRYLSRGLVLMIAAAVSGCGVKTETPAQCVERFTQFVADNPALRGGRFQPVFTYDVTHMEDVLEHFAGDPGKRAGLQMTLSHGANASALQAFYEAEASPKGAIFAADDVTLFRVGGTPGSPQAALVEGCGEAPPKARLVRVQWIALPSRTDDQSAT